MYTVIKKIVVKDYIGTSGEKRGRKKRAEGHRIERWKDAIFFLSLSNFPGCCRCCCHSAREPPRHLPPRALLDAPSHAPWTHDPRHIAAHRFRLPRSKTVAAAQFVAASADYELAMLICPSISPASLCVSVPDTMVYSLK